jgi:hypothetical protein
VAVEVAVVTEEAEAVVEVVVAVEEALEVSEENLKLQSSLIDMLEFSLQKEKRIYLLQKIWLPEIQYTEKKELLLKKEDKTPMVQP